MSKLMTSAPTPIEGSAAPYGMSTVQATNHRLQQAHSGRDWVIDEHPVALVYNGIAHVVMMATPVDLEHFALGFSLSEGIIEGQHELYDLDVQHGIEGTEVLMTISSRAFAGLKDRKRGLAGRTGCGLCGTESLAALELAVPRITTAYDPAWLDMIPAALALLPEHQPLNLSTGGAHAAAWVTRDGQLLAVFEDVGRHNALDKLLGYLAQHGTDRSRGFVLMTSRASFELVRKCALLNIALLACISAPTSLAIRLADQAGLGLASFCRGEGYVVYNTAS
jgi:FdhD protein